MRFAEFDTNRNGSPRPWIRMLGREEILTMGCISKCRMRTNEAAMECLMTTTAAAQSEREKNKKSILEMLVWILSGNSHADHQPSEAWR